MPTAIQGAPGSAASRRPSSKPRARTAAPPSHPLVPTPARRFLVLHGPNLNLLGTREPHVYGTETLADIDARLVAAARLRGAVLETFQSNFEGALIERVHAAKSEQVTGIIINPAGLTHTSVSLRDALTGVAIPFVEVHLSNVHAREPFRHHSYFSSVALGAVVGLGSRGYDFALEFLLGRP